MILRVGTRIEVEVPWPGRPQYCPFSLWIISGGAKCPARISSARRAMRLPDPDGQIRDDVLQAHKHSKADGAPDTATAHAAVDSL